MKKKGKIRTSLRFSLIDGIFAASMIGLITNYITPYALALKATNSQIGILVAFPSLIAAFVQLKSADLVDRAKSRKKIVNTFVLLQGLTFIPIILIPYLFKWQGVLFLIIFVALFTSFGAIAFPAWASLMSDYIPHKSRGRYFGWRSKIMGIITVLAGFLAGIILHITKGNIFIGFSIIFGLALVTRLLSLYFLTKMSELPFKVKNEAYFSFLDFIKRIRESNFAMFTLFVASFNFCVSLASPFFSVFMLRDLGFSYLTYTVVITTITITHILFIDRWGKEADRVGNIKCLRATSIVAVILPALWIINHSPFYLIFIQMIGGLVWSGFTLCAINFIYDSAVPEKRARCVAYFSFCNGLAICLGALLGGGLVNILPHLFGYKLLSLFLLSSILRLFVVLFFLGKIQDVKKIKPISSRDLFYSILGFSSIPK
ncbi:MFS transporter [bacterium]|nr:MFS transporter [bacterium]